MQGGFTHTVNELFRVGDGEIFVNAEDQNCVASVFCIQNTEICDLKNTLRFGQILFGIDPAQDSKQFRCSFLIHGGLLLSDLKTECEKSFYKELYQLGEKNQWIVVETTSEKLYLRKSLLVYNEDVLRYLKEHRCRNLPRVQAFWKEDDGTLTLIEEYVQGETLTACMNRDPLKKEQKAEVIAGVLEALSFLHSAVPPVIHRDVKPDNIVIAENGNVFLVDYDAAKVYRSGQKKDTVLLGTEGIAAPEQYGFAQSDIRTDIYASGMLIRELFPGDAAMEKVAEKATRMDPVDRYQSVEELLGAFRSALGGEGENAAPGKGQEDASFGTVGTKRTGKKKNHMGILIAVLLAVIGVQIILAVVVYPRYARAIMENAGEETSGGDFVAAASTEEAAVSPEKTLPEEAMEQDAMKAAEESVEDDRAAETAEILAPEVVESGYTILDKKASYGVVVRNPNEEYALKNVCVYATVKGTNGTVLASDYVKIRYIAAGDTVFIGTSDQLKWNEREGDTIEIHPSYSEMESILQEDSDVLYLNQLPVTNTSSLQDRYRVRHTGEVENLSGRDVDAVCITGVYRKNGEIVGGWYGFVENLGDGEKRPFDMKDLYFESEFDSCDICALEWNRN